MNRRPEYFKPDTDAHQPQLRVGDSVKVWDNSYVLMVTPAGLQTALPAGTMVGGREWTNLRLVALNCVLPTDCERKEVINDAIVVCTQSGTVLFVRSFQLKPA